MESGRLITVGVNSDYYTCKYCKVLLPKENFNVLHHKCFEDVDLENEDICADPDSFIFRSPKNLEAYETITEKKEKAWSRYDELLIEAVKNRPCLWDYSIPAKNRSPQAVNRAWKEVVEELEDKFDLETIKKRWRNLRDSYNKAKKKEKDVPVGSAVSDDGRRDGFRFYNKMMFLSDASSHMIFSNLYDMSAELDEHTGNMSSAATSKEQPMEYEKRKRRRTEITTFQRDLIQFITKSVEPPKEMDRTDGFLLHLGEVMRKLPYRNRRILEVNISKLVLKTEEECGLLDDE